MSPQSYGEVALRTVSPLRTDDTIESAVARLLDSGMPALPVVDAEDRYAGIFGEREFMAALFPGYLKELRHSGFLARSLDDALERRESCRADTIERHMNTEHIDVAPDYADTQVAEIFLHHRVLVVPVVERGQIQGVLTRSDFFRAVAKRFVE